MFATQIKTLCSFFRNHKIHKPGRERFHVGTIFFPASTLAKHHCAGGSALLPVSRGSCLWQDVNINSVPPPSAEPWCKLAALFHRLADVDVDTRMQRKFLRETVHNKIWRFGFVWRTVRSGEGKHGIYRTEQLTPKPSRWINDIVALV